MGEPPAARPRIALLTLEALANARAVRSFVDAHHDHIGLMALSNPFRRQRGGLFGQVAYLLRRSGPRLLPYLAANFLVPRIAGFLSRRSFAIPEENPLRLSAQRHGIALWQGDEMNDSAFHAALRRHRIDLLVTFHCDHILSAETLAVAPMGGINVHAGLLPDHRGPTPTIHALLEPVPRFGFTIHRMTPRIDVGEILVRETVSLRNHISALAAAEALHAAAVQSLLVLLDDIAAGTVRSSPASENSYPGFPTRMDLAVLSVSGRRTADLQDFRRAWSTPV
jgi:methionyl-tRNA formyltransferase